MSGTKRNPEAFTPEQILARIAADLELPRTESAPRRRPPADPPVVVTFLCESCGCTNARVVDGKSKRTTCCFCGEAIGPLALFGRRW